MEKKLTVMDMAKYLGVSKEAIYNRLRRGTLESVLEDGKKYVILTDTLKREGRLPKRTNITTNLDSDYVDLLKSQVEELKIKNQKLEDDKDRLLLDKERTLANVPSLQNNATKKIDIEEESYIEEIEIEEDIVDKMCESFEDWQGLKEYFRGKIFTSEEERKIEKKVKKQIGSNKNVKSSNGEVYIKKNIKLLN